MVTGKWFLDEICRKQQVFSEIEYFGLRYVSCKMLSVPTKHWMDLTKNVHLQLKHTNPLLVSFRIKHYPPDPFNDFKLDKSKYLLFHQLHRDFLSGRLIAPHDDLIKIAALFVQVILGDASELEQTTFSNNVSESATGAGGKTEPDLTYLTYYRALHNNHSRKNELEILQEHRKLEGLLPSEAAAEAIRIALRQPSYGLEPVKVQAKHKNSRPVHIGLTHEGVAEFVGCKLTHLFKWAVADQFFYSGSNFIISYRKPVPKGHKPVHATAKYKCECRAIASELWSWVHERRLFFTLEKSSSAKPIRTKYNLFTPGHTFNFSGRCRSEVMDGKKPTSATLPNLHRVSNWTHPHSASADAASRRSLQNSLSSPMLSSGSRGLSASKRFTIPAAAASNASTSREALVEVDQGSSDGLFDARKTPRKTPSTFEGPQELVKLAPFFESIPNRKYASLSRLRQNRSSLFPTRKVASKNEENGVEVNEVEDESHAMEELDHAKDEDEGEQEAGETPVDGKQTPPRMKTKSRFGKKLSPNSSKLGKLIFRTKSDNKGNKPPKPRKGESGKHVAFLIQSNEHGVSKEGDTVYSRSAESEKENAVSIASENVSDIDVALEGHSIMDESIAEVQETETPMEEIHQQLLTSAVSPKKNNLVPASLKRLFSSSKKKSDDPSIHSPDLLNFVDQNCQQPPPGGSGLEIEHHRDKPLVSCRWRRLLIGSGIVLAVTLLGTSVAADLEIPVPLLSGMRGSALFVNWEDQCYRPFRSLLLGLFH